MGMYVLILFCGIKKVMVEYLKFLDTIIHLNIIFYI